jgi:hypothetical protein
MALYLLLMMVVLGCVRGLLDWRSALYAMVLIAALQDPLRKLIPGTPGWLVLATAPVLAVAALQMMLSQPYWWRAFRANYPPIARAMGWLGLACLPAASISATYGSGSWMLTLLGAFSYSVLLMSIVLGYHLPLTIQTLRRVLGFYCIVSAVMLTGGYLEYLDIGHGSPLIGTENLGIQWVRYSGDYVVDLVAGFYRSPDVMGWHAAATVMLSVVLALTSRGGPRWGWLLLGTFAMGALLLCGRRKMVFMIPVFFALIICLYWAFSRRQGVTSLLAIALVPVMAAGLVGGWLNEDSAQIRYYADNSVDTIDQLERHGIDSVVETVRQAGFFGSGLGVATPGSHHLNVERPRVWQESGPSRVMVELGVPGFIALIFLVLTLFRAAWWVSRYHLQSASPYAGYVAGLMAFFTVNISSLVVSGQILADPFIASFIGLMLGVVLSFGRFYPVSSESAPHSPAAQVARTAMAVMPPWAGAGAVRSAAQSDTDLRSPPTR